MTKQELLEAYEALTNNKLADIDGALFEVIYTYYMASPNTTKADAAKLLQMLEAGGASKAFAEMWRIGNECKAYQRAASDFEDKYKQAEAAREEAVKDAKSNLRLASRYAYALEDFERAFQGMQQANEALSAASHQVIVTYSERLFSKQNEQHAG